MKVFLGISLSAFLKLKSIQQFSIICSPIDRVLLLDVTALLLLS